MANEQRYITLQPKAGTKIVDTHASPADQLFYEIPFRCNFRQLKIVTQTTEVTPCAYSLDKRVTSGSDTNRVEDIATLAIPSSLAGKVYYKNASSRQQFVPGDELVLELTTASTADKIGIVEIIVDRSVESDANESDEIASA